MITCHGGQAPNQPFINRARTVNIIRNAVATGKHIPTNPANPVSSYLEPPVMINWLFVPQREHVAKAKWKCCLQQGKTQQSARD